MKKILSFILITASLLQACKKDSQSGNAPGRFEVIVPKSSVDGNLIMGQATTSANTFTLVTKNTPKAAATISSDTINGLYIKSSSVSLAGDSIKLPLSGTPVIDGIFNITVTIKLSDAVYVCTKEFYVDLPNYSAITSTLPADTSVNDVIDSAKINFNITPYTTAFGIAVPAHLTAQITNNSRESRTLTIYADNQFVSGDVVITSTFKNVPVLTSKIHVSAFSGGDGSVAKPFQVGDTLRLSRIQYAADKAYQLIANITGPKTTLSGVTLTGSIDGNGKTISNYTLNSSTNNSGFLAAIGASGTVKNLSFTNMSVSGKDYVGGLAGINNGTINNVTIAGNIAGNNYVAALAGNNFGSIISCDASNANVSGTNYIATLAGNTNSGSAQTGNVVLSTTPSFPTEVYGLASTQTIPFAFTPSGGTITVKSAPTGMGTVVSGQSITFNPPAGFISGNMQLSLQSGKLSCTRNVMLYSKTQGALFDAGNGSSSNPYIISTEAALRAIINDPTKYYQLAADIALSNTPWTTIPAFSGSFDGSGYKISNLIINSTGPDGGFISKHSGTIKNVQLLNVNATTTSTGFGIIAGIQTGGLIQNAIVTGTITSTSASAADTLGGVVGTLTSGGTITQCGTNISITTPLGMVGGIVGCLTASSPLSTISYCTTKGSITITAAKNRIGGILGRAGGGTAGTVGGKVTNCASSATIKSTDALASSANGIGGIFGADQNAGTVPIDQCMFTGTVITGFSMGGIAGVGSNITNCLVNGATLTSNNTPSTGSIGGIAGTDKNLLTTCIVKNSTIQGIGSASLQLGGIVSSFQNNGYVANSVVINSVINASTPAYAFRIFGNSANSTVASIANNYVGPNVSTSAGTYTDSPTGADGGNTPSPFNQSFFQNTLGFNFSSIWKMDTDGYPTLSSAGYNGNYIIP
ncbi:MAG: hypothetical protein J0I09_12345 [Sphingobacteriia bacterium]|nr:hypothetical protein [Sphingobacteriia bacterium]